MMAPSYHPYPSTPVVHQPYYINTTQTPTSYPTSSPAAPMLPSTSSFASGPIQESPSVFSSPSVLQTAYFPSSHDGSRSLDVSPPHTAHSRVKQASTHSLPSDMRSLPYAGEYTSFAPASSPGSSRRSELPIGRRQRVTMACTYCRRRKIRCDGGSPCTNCTRGHRCCDYTPISATESTKASRARKMAQALKDSMSEDMSRPGTGSTSSDAAEHKRVEGDFAFGVEHSFAQPGIGSYEHVQHNVGQSQSIKPSRHIGNFQPLQETPSVLLPSAAIASPNAQTAQAGLRPTGVPMIYQPVHSSTLASPLVYEYPRQVRPQTHPGQMSYTAVGPLSPPYTPLTTSGKQQTMSMPTSVDLSVTPDLVTPMTGFGFDNSMMTYNGSYPSRQEVGKYQTIAIPTHSQGLMPGTTFVHGNGYHGMTSASTPVSPVHPGPLRRTVSHVPHGTHLAPSTYVPQMVNGGLVGLGIMMPTGDGELFNGLMPQDKTGPAIYSGM